ncbi:MAG: hypothetical protein ACT4O3_04755, partial [Elusimicrobiota bacterium]
MTLTLLSVGFVAAVSAFLGLSKGIYVNKTKSLATNMAQEKVEVLKNKSYYRLRVTTAAVEVSGVSPVVLSDPYNYNESAVNVGGIPFTRYVVV